MSMVSMRWRRHSSAVLLLVLAATGASAAAAQATDPSRLVPLVRQDCGSCHGLTLKGGLGRPLLPADLKHFDRETLAGVILDGIPGTAMPPWRGLLSEDDARWIAGKLKEGFPQ